MKRSLLAVLLGLLVSPMALAPARAWLDRMETVAEEVARDVRHVVEGITQEVDDDFLEPATAKFRDVGDAEDAVLRPAAETLKKAVQKPNRVLEPFARELGEVLKKHASHAASPRPACMVASGVLDTFRQQRSGTANATGDTRADACDLAQARARSAAQQSCDGPFDVDDCQCSQNPKTGFDGFDSYSCSARWGCQSLSQVGEETDDPRVW